MINGLIRQNERFGEDHFLLTSLFLKIRSKRKTRDIFIFSRIPKKKAIFRDEIFASKEQTHER